MISGKAMIECGTGSTVSTWMFNPNTDIGMILIKSKEPGDIGQVKMSGEYDFNDAEVKFYFHNVKSLKSLTNTFMELINIMETEG